MTDNKGYLSDKPNTPHIQSDPNAINVGFIGFPGAGKTMMTLVMHTALLESLWEINPANDKTLDFIEPLQSQLLQDGKLPPPTNDRDQLFFNVKKRAGFWGLETGLWPPITVSVLEAPGGDSIPGYTGFSSETLKYISHCSGFLFLLDSQELWQTALEVASKNPDTSNREWWYAKYNVLFNQIFTRLQMYRDSNSNQMKSSKTYMAICLTKMDLFPAEWNFPMERAYKFLGEMAMKQILNFCSSNPDIEARWFSTSAIGFTEEDGIVKPRLQNGKVIRPDKLQPEGIKEAVEWLLGSIHRDIEGGTLISRWKKKFFGDKS